jgi:Sulfotransferase family
VSAPGPVFVGGAPRSGTHVLAYLIGQHRDYYTLPREMFFHCAERGLPAYLAGTLDRREFASDLLGRWWRRKTPWHPDGERGLHQVIAVEAFEATIAALLTAPRDDRAAAGRALIGSLFDPLAAGAGKRTWVEHSPRNMNAADELSSLLPEAKFIHVVRDGRDQACSIVRLPFRSDSVPDELALWARDLRSAEAGSRSLPAEKLFVVQLEDLVLFDREQTLDRLVAFLGLEDDIEPMRRFFDAEVTPERAHIGRSRVELAPQERDHVDAVYRELREELIGEGISCVPPERELTATYSGPTPAHPFDPWSFRSAEA